jgi:hypothetical protein
VASKLGEYPAVFQFYEDGKSRRYNLLFAVNGGVLAIAKFFPSPGGAFLSELTVRQVAAGMAIFTVLMGIDIWVFGMRMREAGKDTGASAGRGIFSWWGRGVLAAICTLLVLAWLAVILSPGAIPAD